MAKYTKDIKNRIVELIKSDTYTVDELCKIVGINRTTYYEWLAKRPDFAQAIEDANKAQQDTMVVEAKKSLLKMLRGYDVKETTVVTVPTGKTDPATGKPEARVKEQKTKTKHVSPDTASIIFVLTNGDPEHWKNKQSTEVTGKDGKDLFQGKTDEDLDKIIAELKKKLE